jgi:hypothetical protein
MLQQQARAGRRPRQRPRAAVATERGRTLTAASRWASVGWLERFEGNDDPDDDSHHRSTWCSRPRHCRGIRCLCTDRVRRGTKRCDRVLGAVACGTRPRPHPHSGCAALSLPHVLDGFSGAIPVRVSGARLRARMHILAGPGESPERPGHRSENALLVAARYLNLSATPARPRSAPAIAAAAMAGDTRWVRPL